MTRKEDIQANIDSGAMRCNSACPFFVELLEVDCETLIEEHCKLGGEIMPCCTVEARRIAKMRELGGAR